MSNEETHYRTIPEVEYQNLKALADGNKLAIEEIFNNIEFLNELSKIRTKLIESRQIIKDFLFYFDDMIDLISNNEATKHNYSLRFNIRRLLELKEKL